MQIVDKVKEFFAGYLIKKAVRRAAAAAATALIALLGSDKGSEILMSAGLSVTSDPEKLTAFLAGLIGLAIGWAVDLVGFRKSKKEAPKPS